jgi:hypothetical protein
MRPTFYDKKTVNSRENVIRIDEKICRTRWGKEPEFHMTVDCVVNVGSYTDLSIGCGVKCSTRHSIRRVTSL